MTLAGGSEPENPHRLLIGRLDAAFAVVFLVPLIIIALNYALLAGERERGTLVLLLSQPLTLPRLLAGKFVPRLALTPALLALLAALFLVATPAAFGLRLVLWIAIAFAYEGFWFALSAAVIMRNGSSAKHAVTLAATWLALTMLLPAAINLAVKTVAPMPSRIDLILALREATDARARIIPSLRLRAASEVKEVREAMEVEAISPCCNWRPARTWRLTSHRCSRATRISWCASRL